MIPDIRPGVTGSASIPPARQSGFLFVRAFVAMLVFVVALAAPLATFARQTPPEPLDRAAVDAASVAILGQQGTGGAFVGFSGEPDVAATLDALTALAAARAVGVEVEVEPILAYIAAEALVFSQGGPANAARLVLALAAVGADPTDIATVDPLSLVAAGVDDATGLCGLQIYEHSLCVLALVAGDTEVPSAWVDTLRTNQNEDGGWVYDGSAESRTSDSNTTAVVLQAMIAAGVAIDDPSVVAGRDFLRTLIADGGGFAYLAGGPLVADANSTALGIQALIALGEDPRAADWGDPVAALLALQNDSGLFAYSAEYPDDNLFCTVQALPALAGLTMPLIGVR